MLCTRVQPLLPAHSREEVALVEWKGGVGAMQRAKVLCERRVLKRHSRELRRVASDVGKNGIHWRKVGSGVHKVKVVAEGNEDMLCGIPTGPLPADGGKGERLLLHGGARVGRC